MDIQQIYGLLIADTSILTLTQLAKRFGFGSKQYDKMRHMLYAAYGKEHVQSITRKRMAYHRLSLRNNKPVKYSDQSKARMSEAQKLSWSKSPDSRRKMSAELMRISASPNSRKPEARKKAINTRRKNGWSGLSEKWKSSFCAPKIPSDQTRQRMQKSAIKRGRTLPSNFKHSDTTKQKLSKITKLQWESGVHVPIFRSKGQLEIENVFRSRGYTVQPEYLIDGRPFDMYILELNLLVEFNGTYWHADPRKYIANQTIGQKKIKVHEIWKRDNIKLALAEKHGYIVKVIWQLDWELKGENIVNELIHEVTGIKK